MQRLVATTLLVCSFGFAAAAHAQNVNGTANKITANGTRSPAANYNVKFCKAAANGAPSTLCTTSVTSSAGVYSFNVGHGTGRYFVYFWHDPSYWGSDQYPNFFTPATVSTANAANPQPTADVFPRSAPASAIYPPPNEHDVPPNFILNWKSGVDTTRCSEPCPIVYDIWASGNEFPQQKVISDFVCPTALSMQQCSYAITNLPYTNRFEWRVVGKMKTGPVVIEAGVDNSYPQSSPTFHFSTTWDPGIPHYTIESWNGPRWLAADGGGSSLFASAPGISTYETNFGFQDLNGGALTSGDPVCIYTNRNYYVIAYEGQGQASADSKWCMGYETWVIELVSGGGIGGGSTVAFRHNLSNLYLTAANCGGGSLHASAPTRGACEQFRLKNQ